MMGESSPFSWYHPIRNYRMLSRGCLTSMENIEYFLPTKTAKSGLRWKEENMNEEFSANWGKILKVFSWKLNSLGINATNRLE